MLLCYITDRLAFAGDEHRRRRQLLDKIAEAAEHGVDYVQLREKDLPDRALESLAREATHIINQKRGRLTAHGSPVTALLINSRTDVALAVGAHGVHLRTRDLSPKEVRAAWVEARNTDAPSNPSGSSASKNSSPLISVSCHSPQEVAQAADNGAAFALLAPVFEKEKQPGATSVGLAVLREACEARIPVLALGGVTLRNAQSCVEAGAAGIAAIRLFQENSISAIVREFAQLGSNDLDLRV